jgi:hypothetical protein
MKYSKLSSLLMGIRPVGQMATLLVSSRQLGQLSSMMLSIAITLVPKIPNPSSIWDVRPISCCNIIYKCITKILAN